MISQRERPAPVLLYAGSSGINTVLDPIRLPINNESGIVALSEAVNVSIDNTGRVSRRKGFTEFIDLPCQSIFCDGFDCLFVSESTLYRLLSDYSRQVVFDGLIPGNRVSYTQVNKDIYFTSLSNKGIVLEGGTYKPWEYVPYVGPVTNRTFVEAPLAKHIAFFAGRILLALGNALVWTEPFGWSYFDLARNYGAFDSDITMVKAVAGGVFVSSSTATYFLKGTDPKAWVQEKVAKYPSIEYTVAIDLFEGSEVGFEEPGLYAIWSSTEGVCIGSPSGLFYNISTDKIVFPIGNTGAGLVRNNTFITSIGG
jgi:hypothetical protein